MIGTIINSAYLNGVKGALNIVKLCKDHEQAVAELEKWINELEENL